MTIQLNLSIADMLYSGHLSMADTIRRNGWNHSHSLIEKPLYRDRNSGHLSIADTILWNQWHFCIEIYLCIADSYYSIKVH